MNKTYIRVFIMASTTLVSGMLAANATAQVAQTSGAFLAPGSQGFSVCGHALVQEIPTQFGTRIRVQGSAGQSPFPDCNHGLQGIGLPPRVIAINYQLFKWNGSAAEQCAAGTWQFNEDWPELPTDAVAVIFTPAFGNTPASRGRILDGCGAGWYNVGVHGFRWTGSFWEGGTLFSGWTFLNLPDPPPPPV